MARRYRFSYRPTRKKYVLLVLALILLAAGGGAGYYFWHRQHTPKKLVITTPSQEAKYVSLAGGYLFSIPKNYSVDETAIPGATIIYPQDVTLAGKTIVDMYNAGVVVAQPIADLKDNNVKAFKDYVNNKIGPDLQKAMHSGVDIREAKQGDINALKVFAITNDGKRLRALYAIDFTKPMLIAAKDETDVLKVVGGTAEDLSKTSSKPDIDAAALAVKSMVELLQRKDTNNIIGKATDEFNKNMPPETLTVNTCNNDCWRCI
jgi:hypothetical protein